MNNYIRILKPHGKSDFYFLNKKARIRASLRPTSYSGNLLSHSYRMQFSAQ